MRTSTFVIILTLYIFYLGFAQSSYDDFIRGVDLSFVKQIEDLGGKYYYNGVQKDVLDIFKENGVNYVRLRLWHSPADGYCGTAKTIEYAKKVKAKGLKLHLDFHYSDWWADPAKQNKPAAWVNISYDALKDSVYAYTKYTIEAFRNEGIVPDMVQIGNEVTAGILWPEGKISTSWAQFAELIKQGIRGARDAMTDTTVKIMIHIDKGGNNSTSRWFFDNLLSNGVQFDVIGLSYYPWWHGGFDNVVVNLNDLATRYNKDIIIVETAYPWTTQYLNDGMSNVGIDPSKLPPGYGISPQAQKAFLFALTKILKETANNRGRGFFYWEPAYISVPPIGSSWEHCTTFDFSGNASNTITAFLNFDTIQTVTVTFRFNTATNPDTLHPTGVLQLRGEVSGIGSNFLPNGKLLTWDSYTQVQAENIGGDYWEARVRLYPNDQLRFKLWTGHSPTKATYWNIGTEGKILPYDGSTLNTRLFVAGFADTVVGEQYYSSSLSTAKPQYWSPFLVKEDSIGILFRVNLSKLMANGLFDPSTQGPVVVRGDSTTSAGVLSWYTNNIVLTREPVGVSNNSFWSGVAYFPKKSISPGTPITYSFYIENSMFGGWEMNIGSRVFTFPCNDTTLLWQYFNNGLTPTEVTTQETALPTHFSLFAYPNPFNSSCVLVVHIPKNGVSSLVVYNALGQKICTLLEEIKVAGVYTFQWNGRDDRQRDVGAGVYFVVLQTEYGKKVLKLAYIK